MPRKLQKGYFVRGQFVAEGSELDLQLKAEQKGAEISRSDLKRESTERQKLGEELCELRRSLLETLGLPDRLVDAMEEAQSIHHFEGRRRHLQYVGKLMRTLSEQAVDAIRATLASRHSASAEDTQLLHRAESWRDALLADDAALTRWMEQYPESDTQQLRALIRQTHKDHTPTRTETSQGLAPRHGRAYRELFQLIRSTLGQGATGGEAPANPENSADD